MPLRDHFHAPGKLLAAWQDVHSGWPATIAFRLNTILPPEYRSGLNVHLGSVIAVDVATFERGPTAVNGAAHAQAWQTEAPTLLLETEELTPAEYEVRIYDTSRTQRLVAAVELISPSNKDRLQTRRAFVDKCHALLQQEVCVVLVDVVTDLQANLYAELAERIGARPPAIADAWLYAVSCRTRPGPRGVRVETWEHRLHVGERLPTLPLWVNESLAVPLELEATYEDTCRGLRIE